MAPLLREQQEMQLTIQLAAQTPLHHDPTAILGSHSPLLLSARHCCCP